MNINKNQMENFDSNKFNHEGSEEDICFKEYLTYPEESILLDIDLNLSHWELSIEAIKKIIKDRDMDQEIIIKKQNRKKNILNINDFCIQVATCGLGSEEVTIPLKIWDTFDKAPQIILIAQVDDENNIIFFQGILTGSKFKKYLYDNFLEKRESVTMQTSEFEGGIDKLFSYIKFFNKESLSRIGIKTRSKVIQVNKGNRLSWALVFIFISGLIFGRNLINPKLALDNNNKALKEINLAEEKNSDINLNNPKLVSGTNTLKNLRGFYQESSEGENNTDQNLIKINNFNLANKCLDYKFSNLTSNMFKVLINHESINIANLKCSTISKINQNISNSFLTTGRSKGESVICLSDDKENNPCRFIIGKFKDNISPTIALANATGFNIPETKFLNETTARIFIKISDVFEN